MISANECEKKIHGEWDGECTKTSANEGGDKFALSYGSSCSYTYACMYASARLQHFRKLQCLVR